MSGEVTLYHWEPVGDSFKAIVCLNEKGVAFTSRYVDVLEFEQYAEDYLALSPQARVPVLVHGDRVFNEPKLLCEYIEDAFPEPALAQPDAAGWYDVQEWIRYVDGQFAEAVNLLGWYTVMLPAMGDAARASFDARLAAVPVREQLAGWAAVVRDAESMEDRLENARAKVREALPRVERTLSSSDWLVAGRYSIADISAYAWLRSLPALMPTEIDPEHTPGVTAWLARVASRDAVHRAETLARRDPGTGLFSPA